MYTRIGIGIGNWNQLSKAVFAGEGEDSKRNQHSYGIHCAVYPTWPPIIDPLPSLALALVSCFLDCDLCFWSILVFIRKKQDILFVSLLSRLFSKARILSLTSTRSCFVSSMHFPFTSLFPLIYIHPCLSLPLRSAFSR